MIEIEQYRQMLPDFTAEALAEERAFALGEEWEERYAAIQAEMHKRGLIDDEELARDPFDPATIAKEEDEYVSGLDDAGLMELFDFVDQTYAPNDEREPIDRKIADEVTRRGLKMARGVQ